MYCLQWFLPLVLLSRPLSSPIFLATYLLSMMLHHRPCFVCTSAFLGVLVASAYTNGAAWIDFAQPPYDLQLAHWAEPTHHHHHHHDAAHHGADPLLG